MNSRLSPANGAKLAPARRSLERAHARRADGDDAAAALAATLDGRTGFRGHFQPLGMQLVVLDALRAHGRERTGADVQRQKRALDAARGERVEHCGIEVQAPPSAPQRRPARAQTPSDSARDPPRQASARCTAATASGRALRDRARASRSSSISTSSPTRAPTRARARPGSSISPPGCGLWLARRCTSARRGAEHALEQELDAPARRLAAQDARRQHARVVEDEQIARLAAAAAARRTGGPLSRPWRRRARASGSRAAPRAAPAQ